MTTSGQGGGRLRYSPISVHELHAESACATSVQEGGLFRYSFWTTSIHNDKKGQLSLTNPRDACETFAWFM